MFIEERHKKILEMLNRDGRIKARDIQEQLDVAFDTARRDLRILEEKGLLKRTHGGAIPLVKVGFTTSPTYTPRDITEFKSNYWAITLEAIACIDEHDVIYLTGASIGYFMAQNLPTDFEFTVVTNSIIIAEEIRKYDNVAGYLLGGQLDKKGRTRCHFTTDMINNMRFDKSFITGAAYSTDFGISIQTPAVIPVIQAVIKNTRHNIGLFPHEKMDRVSILKISPPNALQTLITDWETTQEEIEKVTELGVEVIIAKEE